MQPIEKLFSLVLPTRGTRVLCELTTAGVKNQTYEEGVPFSVMVTDALELDAGGSTVYMALGGFAPETVSRRKGRTSDNARWFRSIWFDIDVGDNKDYTTLKDASDALVKFVNETGVPSPTLVHSGYGWHVYWPLTEDVPAASWQAVASGFKALAIARGLKIDPSATADAARILRPAQTHNYKRDTPREVKLVQVSQPVPLELLAKFVPQLPVPVAAPLPANGKHHGVGFGLDAISASRPESFNAAKIIRGCQQFAWAMEHQADVKEPMWRAMVATLYRTDTPTIIHDFSRNHPGYSYDETEKKAKGWDGGGVTCTMLEQERPVGCIGCPKYGLIKSPSWFGAQGQELPPAKIDESTGMPDSWIVRDNAICIRSDDGPQLLYNGVIEFGVPFKERDPNSKNEIQYLPLIAKTPYDKHELYLHMGVHASVAELRKAFSTVGIVPEVRAEKEFYNGMRAWIQRINDEATSVKPARQMGWQSHEMGRDDVPFVLGNTLYMPGAKIKVRIDYAAEKHARHMHTEGSFDEWKQAINLYNRPEYASYALMSWLMFGAPLARFTGVGMPIAHFNSQGSGHGKTGTQDLLLSGAGDPRDPNGRWTGNTTIISIYAYLTAMNGNIAVLDETSAIQPEVLSRLMFEATLGSGRKAMQGASGQTRDLPPITGLLCTSGNVSLQQLAQTMKGNSEAQVARVFEFNVQRPNLTQEQRYADAAIFRKVYTNYGHAMPVFIDYVVNHQAQVRDAINAVDRRLVQRFGMENEERFWRALLSVCIAGAVIARKLEIINHDVNRLLPAAYAHYEYQRAALQDETRNHHALHQFIQDNQSSVLVVDTDAPLATGVIKLVTALRQPAAHVGVRMRYVQDSSKLYVDRRYLREYCSEKNLDFRTLIANASKEGWLLADQERKDLTAFTKLATPTRVTCCVFDMQKAFSVLDLLKGK